METQPTLFDIEEPAPVLAEYDWIVVSSSAGKDSLAMLDFVCEQAEAAGVLSRVVVVHCDLGRVEWPGTRELAEEQAARYGVRFLVVWRRQGDLLTHIEKMGFFPKPDTRYCTSDHKRDQIFRAFTQLANEAREGDLLQQVEERGKWPDAARRYCTSDQKRAPVHKVYTALTEERRIGRVGNRESPTYPEGGDPKYVRILSCQGMRAQESPARAKRNPFETDKRASNGKRIVKNWLPIHRWTVEQVWKRIADSRAADLVHPCYAEGLPRCSCSFCIFSSRDALILAGHLRPDLLAEYVRIEKKIGHKFRVDLSMAEVQEAVNAGERPAKVADWRMA